MLTGGSIFGEDFILSADELIDTRFAMALTYAEIYTGLPAFFGFTGLSRLVFALSSCILSFCFIVAIFSGRRGSCWSW